jgi:4-hydroxyphenylpyruvate dioxygenase-like putative hemolysin
MRGSKRLRREISIRLDHVAYRVADRDATANFFIDAFGYRKQVEFEISLEDGSKAMCVALEPPEKMDAGFLGWSILPPEKRGAQADYHIPPEIFVSSGPPGSLIDKWVQSRGGGIGGIHHLAYQVSDVKAKMAEWVSKGWMFTTRDPMTCPDLTQVFSKPHMYTNVIYEFIQRDGHHGFCKENVGRLMSSTKDIKP